MAILNTRVILRNDSTANWEAHSNVVLYKGEIGIEFLTDNSVKMKVGDGVKTWAELDYVTSAKTVDLNGDNKTIVIENGTAKLFGFDAAEEGAQPRKNADGEIEWVVPSTETVDGLQTIVSGLQTDVSGLKISVSSIQEILTPSAEGEKTLVQRISEIESAMNGTGEGSVEQKIRTEVATQINDFATKVSDDGIANTFKELVDYVATHGTEAADMVKDITTLQELVGNTSVASQIDSKIANSETKITALFNSVKYEVSNKPSEAIVDYREKEIRILCPTNTQFSTQAVGAGGDSSKYYIGFKAYAPAGAVSFKEDLNTVINDEEMYYFEGNDFAGTDIYGRKYSIVWLPVAKRNDDDTWTYYGTNSIASKYIGWYYSVKWYDANGKVIGSDTIRINLSNEACHNAVEPFYMGNVIKGVSINGTLLDVVNGKVDIPVGAGLKASKEVTIATDGTLGIGEININKLVQDADSELILDGGSAA